MIEQLCKLNIEGVYIESPYWSRFRTYFLIHVVLFLRRRLRVRNSKEDITDANEAETVVCDL